MLRSIAGYLLEEAPLRRNAGVALFRAKRSADATPVLIEASEHGASVTVAARLRRELGFLQELGLSGILSPLEIVERGAATVLVFPDRGWPFLSDLLGKGPLSVDVAVRIALRVARVLGELHQAGFVHGSLCPSNMLVEPASGEVELLGLCVALRVGEAGALSRESAREADLLYAAPERTGRTAQGFDGRADLYSLGAVLYEMLTGQPPFVFDDPLELAHAHLARAAVPVGERRAEVPAVLSSIVAKLLSKSPADRYRRASGLAHDLERVLREGPNAPPFALGRSDAPDARRIRDKPIGREAETALLGRTVSRVREGGIELLLVVGPTGSGKSMFVEGAREALAQQGGLFASARFEEGAAPYAAFAEILNKLAKRLLTEPEDQLAKIREHFFALGEEGGRLLTDLAPTLSLVLGQMPALEELPAVEQRRRLERVVRTALAAFRSDKPILTLFFDDLGEADPASLSLIGQMLADRDKGRLLVIGAIHEEEAASGKPLRIWLSDLAKKKGVIISRIVLAPLSAQNVAGVLADVLSGEPNELIPLARLLNEKAQGNPFSVVQMIESFLAEGLIGRDGEAIHWDERRIRETPIATDAAELAATRMRRLSAELQQVLGGAACVGHVFDARRVALALVSDHADVRRLVADAVGHGMVVALDAEGAGDHAFVHEKVREAALSLVPSEERQRMHLTLARALRAEGISSDERLFDVAHHYGEAISLIDSLEERLVVSDLSLSAGRRARERAAFQAATAFFATGVGLFSEELLRADRELVFALHEERAACEWLVGRHELAEELFSKALGFASTSSERAHVHGQRLAQCTAQARYAAAIEAGRLGLAELGFVLPVQGAAQAAIAARLLEVLRLLGKRSPMELSASPPIADPLVLGRLWLFVGLVAPTYISDTALYFVVILEVVAICVEHGYAEVAPYVYAIFALMVRWMQGDRERGRQFFELAVALSPRTKSIAMRSKVAWAIAACGTHFWSIRRSLPYLARATQYSLDAGDAPYLSYSLHIDVSFRFWSGESLVAVREAYEKAIAMLPQAPDPMSLAILRSVSRMVEALSGRTRALTSFDAADFDDARFVVEIEPTLHYAACLHHTLLAELCYLHGEVDMAYAWIRRAEQRAQSALWLHLETVITVVGALIRAEVARGAAGKEREAVVRELMVAAERLGEWADNCPENYRHEALLVDAEIAALSGKHGQARELYDAAMDAAQKNGFVHREALATELCARYYLSRGKADLARPYFAQSARLYAQWGASPKAEALRAKMPDLLSGGMQPFSQKSMRAESAPVRSGRSLDAAAIVRAAEAIASEIELDRLLGRLLSVILEVAGADRGALVLSQGGALFVMATMTVERAEICEKAPLASQSGISTSVVQYVARTHLPVVVGRGPMGTSFEGDAHLSRALPRSFLGLPLLHRGVLSGVIYLENREVENAFAEGRAEVLSLLSSQAAIAIENAQLIADVRERTIELDRANQELRDELLRREALEAEREDLEEQVIAMQRARLLELSAPLVPITDSVVVIPIVGTLDDARAEDLLRVALTGTSELGLSVLILDITGVTEVSHAVAERLLSMVRAIELLGARVVVTGIRGEVARSLVALDIAFGTKVATRSTLSAGISLALAKKAPALSSWR